MKLHLPLLLRKSVLVGASVLTAMSQFSVTAYAESQNLTFNGTNLTWNTIDENKAFVIGDSDIASSFKQGDNVNFSTSSDVTLGENITAGTITIEAGADVTLNCANFSLEAQRIELSGALSTSEPLHIENGMTLSIDSPTAVLNSNLVLGSDGALSINGIASLNSNNLCLQGDTALNLASTGDGRVYNLFTDVSNLIDTNGSAFALNSDNNKASFYFDATKPGTGFWKDATLQFTPQGTLQLVRYTDISMPDGYRSAIETSSASILKSNSTSYKTLFKLSSNLDINANSEDLSFSNDKAFTSSSTDSLSSLRIYNSKKSLFDVDSLYIASLASVIFESNGNTASSSSEAVYAYGGVVQCSSSIGSLNFDNNGAIKFSENKVTASISSNSSNSAYSYGGAIACQGQSMSICGNGLVSFYSNQSISSNSAYSYGGAMAQGGAIYVTTGSVELAKNANILFCDNKVTTEAKSTDYSTSAFAIGGAVSVEGRGSMYLTDNGSIVFSGNTATATAPYNYSRANSHAQGGAIGLGINSNLSIQDNGEVVFSENIVTTYSSSSTAKGGAIYGNSDSSILIKNNGSVLFYGNRAEVAQSYGLGGAIYGYIIDIKDNKTVIFSNNYGRSVISGSSVNISGNKESVIFNNNFGTAISGGVTIANNNKISFIENDDNVVIDGTSSINKNSFVTFKDNKGTAIDGALMMSENSSVLFDGNKNGAIRSDNDVQFKDNGNISFLNNTKTKTQAYGCAVYAGSINFDNNRSVTFANNVSQSAQSGAAIGAAFTCHQSGSINLINNDSLIFDSNSVVADQWGYARGGAIYNWSSTIIEGNETIIFSNNSAIYTSEPSESYNALGGAIYIDASFALRNNDSVLFEKNAEIENNTYRLRSIYAPSAVMTVDLGARTNGEIRFNDSIYIGNDLSLNKKFNNTIQTGAIIFSGEFTEQHLNDLLANNENRQTATLTEIENSRTSVVNGKTTLYGGALKVESKAILQLNGGLDVTAESNATVLVKNATLDSRASDNLGIVMNSGRLELSDEAKVLGANITIAKGATLAAVAGADNGFNTPVTTSILTLSSNDEATSEVFNAEVGGIITGNLTLQAGSTLVADGAHFVFGDDSELDIEVNYSEKVHLWLTEGVEYGDANQILLFSNVGSLTITVDGEIIDYSNGVLATTVFDGDWVNDDLMLYIDDSNVFVKNVNLVPEPTTATLSLLALAGLAARRRRK